MADELKQKKTPGSGRLFVYGFLLLLAQPLLSLMLCGTLALWFFVFAGVEGKYIFSVNSVLVLSVVTLCLGLLLKVSLNALRRYDFLTKRERVIQQERRRTAKLKRDAHHLEVPESEIDTVTLADDEQRNRQHRKRG